MLQRQDQYRVAAQYVAEAFARLPWVEKVVLFGSVANPLTKEVPRFRGFRQAGIPIWHECKDADLAVWLSGLSDLKALQRTRAQALNGLLRDKNIGVAHHQVDVFIMQPGTNRYLGRLCCFGTCPKSKDECRGPGCGATRLLRQHKGFVFKDEALTAGRSVVLFERGCAPGGKAASPSPGPSPLSPPGQGVE
jgi:hypothetical protein